MLGKQIKLSVIFLSIILILTSCGGKPNNVSESAYNAGIRAIEIADDYLDYKISSEEAGKLIEEIENRKPFNTEEYIGDLDISLNLTTLDFAVRNYLGYGEAEVLNARNGIAQVINKPERK